MDAMTAPTCPRCAGPLHDPDIIEDEDQLSGPSYITEGDDTALCLDCRMDELYRHHHDGRYIPPSEWPMRVGAHDYVRTSEADPDRR